MYPASSELADGSRVGPGKVDSSSLVSSKDLLSLVLFRYFGLEGLLLHGGEQSCEARVRVNAGGTVFETTRATLAGFSKM